MRPGFHPKYSMLWQVMWLQVDASHSRQTPLAIGSECSINDGWCSVSASIAMWMLLFCFFLSASAVNYHYECSPSVLGPAQLRAGMAF